MQLEPAPPLAQDLFNRLCPKHLPSLFVNGDMDSLKSFEIDRLLNKYIVKKSKSQAINHLVC